MGWGWAEGLPDDSGGGGRSGRVGGHLWASGLSGLHSGTQSFSEQDIETGSLSRLDGGTGALSGLNSGTGALSGLDMETGALSGLDMETGALSGLNSGKGALSGLDGGTGALSGLNSGTGDLSGLYGGTAALSGLNSGTGALSTSELLRPRSIISSLSATVQGAELLFALSLSTAFSLVTGIVGSSRTWSDYSWGSGSVPILSSATLLGDGSSVETDSGSPSAVGSGVHSAQRGDGGLGTGSGCVLDRR